MSTQMSSTAKDSHSIDWPELAGRTPYEVVEMLGGLRHLANREPWALGGNVLIRDQDGQIYVVTASPTGIRWKLCKDNDRLREALSETVFTVVDGTVVAIGLHEARLEELKSEAVEVPMVYRAYAGDGFVIYNTGRHSGEQVVIEPGSWATTTARFPFFYRDTNQTPSALPRSSQLTAEDCDQVFGCSYYNYNTLVIAALSGILDPTTKAPWLLFVGDKRQRRQQPLAWSKEILDPSSSPNYHPMNAVEVREQLDHQKIAAFDNLHAWSSDMLGALLDLHTPFDSSIDTPAVGNSPVSAVLAGEKEALYPQELLELCLPVDLYRPAHHDNDYLYCEEGAFLEARGALMGLIFNALANSMANRKPVMDDQFPCSLWPFVSHGRAVAEAMGSTPEEFDDALRDSLALRESLSDPAQKHDFGD